MDKKEQITEIEIEQIKLIAQRLCSESIDSMIPELKRHIQVLEIVQDNSYSNVVKPNEGNGEKKDIDNAVKLVRCAQRIEGTFRRKLRGGFIGTIYISEKLVRDRGFINGNVISAELKYVSKSGKKIYEFAVVDDKEEPMKNRRVVVDKVRVEQEGYLGSLYIRFQAAGDQLLSRYNLSKKDVEKLNLAVGDYIDYSYWDGMDTKGVIIWKYPKLK